MANSVTRCLALLILMSLSSAVLAQAPGKEKVPALGEPWARSLSVDFAFDFYRATVAERKNDAFCCSPHSAMCALAMLAHGTSGKAREEFSRTWPAPGSVAGTPERTWPSDSLLKGLRAINVGMQPSPKAITKMREEISKLEKEVERLPSGTGDPFGEVQFSTPADRKRLELKLERIKELKGDLTPVEIAIASSIWVDRTLPLRPGYVSIAGLQFGAVVESADFVTESHKEIDRINAWCNEKTRGKIAKLADDQNVHPETRILLANAVYFHAAWEDPFARKRTEKAKFESISGQVTEVEMMQEVKRVKFAEFRPDESLNPLQKRPTGSDASGSEWELPANPGGWKMMELPYQGGRFSFVAVLPIDRQGLAALETSMRREHFERWRKALKAQEVIVALPRFKLDSSFDLKPILKRLELNAIFEQGSLQRISDSPRADSLYLDSVVQRTFIDVDEEGTEAAAVTGPGGAGGGEPLKPLPEFTADHPFVYLIRDNRSGVVLFMGRFTGKG